MKINRFFNFGASGGRARIFLLGFFLVFNLVSVGSAKGETWGDYLGEKFGQSEAVLSANQKLVEFQRESPQCYDKYLACLRTVRNAEDPTTAIRSCYLQLETCAAGKDGSGTASPDVLIKSAEPTASAPAIIDIEKPIETFSSCGSFRRIFSSLKSSITGKTDECEAEEAETFEEDVREDFFTGVISDFDLEQQDGVEKQLNEMGAGDNIYLEIDKTDGDTAEIGIVRALDGTYLYTKDGTNFYSSLRRTFRPSFLERAASGTGTFFRALNPGNWFAARYKDDYVGENKEKKFEISRDSLRDFRKRLKNSDNSKRFIQGVTKFVIEKGLGKGIGFAAGVVTGAFDEANTADYAEGARIYMVERQNGRSLENILEVPPTRLEFVLVPGKEEEMGGQAILYASYEEVYQKYLLWQKFNKGQNDAKK